MKDILEIHELTQEMFEYPLEDYILTFDDGLYSQYKYLDQLKALKTTKIFFISTNIICPEDVVQNEDLVHCADAHKKAFSGNYEDYMKWSQIEEIYKSTWCEIGGHGHNHVALEGIKSIRDRYNLIAEDTNSMINTFKSKKMKINSFCYPYNHVDDMLMELLKRNNVEYFYSKDAKHLFKQRIPIEKAFR